MAVNNNESRRVAVDCSRRKNCQSDGYSLPFIELTRNMHLRRGVADKSPAGGALKLGRQL